MMDTDLIEREVDHAAIASSQGAFQRVLIIAAAVGVVSGGAACALHAPLGGGFILGVIAGAAAYLWLARMLPKLATVPKEDLQLYTVRQAAGRLGIYAVAIVLAYKLDPGHKIGVIAALGGYLYVRAAATFAAWRMAKASAQAIKKDTP